MELRRTDSFRRAAQETLSSANAELERRVAQRTAQLQTVVKQAEAAKLHISNMVERMSDGMVAFDIEWRFDYVNRKAGELLGFEPISILGKRLMDVFPEMVGHPFLDTVAQASLEQRSIKLDVYYRARDVWFECRCYPSREGMSFFFQDISNRKRAEAALQEASSRLELAVRASKIGLWSWNVGSNDVFYSAQFKAQLGYADDEFPHLIDSWSTRVHPDDLARVWESVSAHLQDPELNDYEQEYRVRHRDGTYRWILSRARLYRAAGQPDRMVGCHIETTERRATEEALRALAEHLHSVREEEAGRIARELHDELGAALTGLKMDVGWVDRLLAKTVDPVLNAPIHKRIQGINQLLDETIGSVRKVCHALRPAVLDQLGLAAAMDWQCAEFEARTGMQCQLERDEAFRLDDSRATVVFRILQELLTNVARHSGATEVNVTASCDEEEFRLEVQDNGRGLPADALNQKNRFGLVGVRERAAAAAGNASFESSPGGGTTVKVCIPAVCEPLTGHGH
jgi:two-component system sensor histidine kinase UhpB